MARILLHHAIFVCFAAIATASGAPKIFANSPDIVALADFPQDGPHLFMRGYVIFSSHNGNVVNVHVDVTGLPQENGPFYYHIHEGPVANDCSAAGDVLNPFGAEAECLAHEQDSMCAIGDLSGKHGWINTTCFQTSYADPYLSLDANSASGVIGRSIVFHYQDHTKFACANIQEASEEQLERIKVYDLADITEAPVEPFNLEEIVMEPPQFSKREQAPEHSETNRTGFIVNSTNASVAGIPAAANVAVGVTTGTISLVLGFFSGLLI